MSQDQSIERRRTLASERFDELDAVGTTVRTVSDIHHNELGLKPRDEGTPSHKRSDVMIASDQCAQLSEGLKPYNDK